MSYINRTTKIIDRDWVKNFCTKEIIIIFKTLKKTILTQYLLIFSKDSLKCDILSNILMSAATSLAGYLA